MSQSDSVANVHDTVLTTEPMFAVPAKKKAIWLFIIADAATFAGCLLVYGFLRNSAQTWPTPFQASSVANAMLMTFILVSSSLAMLLGIRAANVNNRAAAFRWTMVTALAGIVFAILHIREWLGMTHDGVTMLRNPWNAPLFGATFFSITGLHLLHVVGGVIALLWVGLGYSLGRYQADDLEVTGLYWHFVDLVWMFVVPLVYLLNVAH